MDKTEKFLRRQATKKERSAVAKTISLLTQGETATLNIKKLKGYGGVYRVRIGNIRLIYKKLPDDIEVLSMSHRDEHTYKNL